VKAKNVSISVNTAEGGAALVTFDWDGRRFSKEIEPRAWKKAWERFGGRDISNEEIKRCVEQWLESELRAEDLSSPVLDILWVNAHLPVLNVA